MIVHNYNIVLSTDWWTCFNKHVELELDVYDYVNIIKYQFS